MKNKNVLVTGGGGMVAQQLVKLLRKKGQMLLRLIYRHRVYQQTYKVI